MTLERSTCSRPPLRRAFTLIELLLAITLSALVISAVVGVLFASLRLRNQTARRLELSSSVQQSLALLRRDLTGIALPATDSTNAMAGSLVYGGITGINDPAGTGMQLFTTSGILSELTPWADLQKVGYTLRLPTNAVASIGRDLHRVVTRNLLPQLAETFEDQIILRDVQTFELSFYDGSTWRNTWGGTNETVSIPSAVRVNLVVADADPSERERGMSANRTLLPYQLVIPVLVSPATNSTATTGGQP